LTKALIKPLAEYTVSLERNLSSAPLLPCYPMESSMADNNNKNPNEKQPGEKPEGTYHFNPGNQSGKSKTIPEDRPEPGNNRDAKETREKPSRE
jgi:hypothetical protein